MIEYLNSYTKLEFAKIKNHILKYTYSDLGGEHVLSMTPTNSYNEIVYQLDLTSEMKKLLEDDTPIPLDGSIDIRVTLSRVQIENYLLTGFELHKISNFLKISRNIVSYFNQRKSKYLLLNEIVKPIYIDKILEYNIDRAIDEEGNVRDNASVELKNIRREINIKSELLRKKLDSILKAVSSKGWAQEEIITTRDGRMVIPVKTENKNRVPGFIHSSSASGFTVFIEPAETLEMNNNIRSLHFQETREIEKILKELTEQVNKVKDFLKINVNSIGILDFIQAKAKYSIEILGTAPKIKDNQDVKIIDARHPLLLMKHHRDEVIPLSLEIGNKYNTLIITGPNAGGKTVAIKTVGLLVVMLQSGMHIPVAAESEFCIYNKIFVDIGDEQSIENDLSTFSSHISNLKTIIEEASNRSLILIDEVGAGTDPIEGSALAQALLEYLTKLQAHSLVTTHQGTLKAFAHLTNGIENASMEFDHNTLQPTYRLRCGIPGSSYAIEIAKRMGLSNEIIQRSIELRGQTQQSLENLIAELEIVTQNSKYVNEQLKFQKIQLDNMVSEYEQKSKSLQKDLKEIKLRAIEEAKQIIENANKIIEGTVQLLREENGSKASIKKVKDVINQVKDEYNNLYQNLSNIDESRSTVELPIGVLVKLKDGTEVGKIIEDIGNGFVNVLFGQMKVKVNSKDLITVDKNKRQYSKSNNVYKQQFEKLSREIDLRGMTGEEALSVIDKFIDDAILQGLHRIDLIHGKGTGALRTKITEYLKKHIAVKSYRLGDWNEGGYGVTVVELK